MDYSIQKSGLVKKEFLLLMPFVKEPWREFTLSEIKKITRNKSHHYVYEALEKFVNKNILIEVKKGNTNIYFINIENTASQHYVYFVESLIKEKRTDLPLKNLQKILEKIKNPFFSLILTGSYANKKQKPTSDLDIAIIISNKESKKPYEIALKEGELVIPEVHGFVFKENELYLMLTNQEFNYGKELARKHIIIFGAESYYKILFKAMKNGFKGGYISKKSKN